MIRRRQRRDDMSFMEWIATPDAPDDPLAPSQASWALPPNDQAAYFPACACGYRLLSDGWCSECDAMAYGP
jgi:hypothetical protein